MANDEKTQEAGAEAAAAKAEPKAAPKPRGEYEAPRDIIEGNKAAERIENATAALKAENDRLDERDVRARLGGGTEAGTESKPKTPEEVAEEKSQARVMAVGQAGGAQWAKKD